MEKKKPLETKIPKNIEVEPSIEIQIQKQKKNLNLILYWYLSAAELFVVRKKIRLIPNNHVNNFNSNSLFFSRFFSTKKILVYSGQPNRIKSQSYSILILSKIE